MKYLSVLPKELDDLPNNTIGTKPIGTGPFYVKAWMQNLKMVLRKNQLYFETNEEGAVATSRISGYHFCT